MDDPTLSLSSINTVDINTQTILLHASQHDIPSLKPYLRIPGNANVQDPETGFTPLHAAIAACGEFHPVTNNGIPKHKNGNINKDGEQVEGGGEGDEEDEVDIEKACATVRELLLNGAIWNDLDINDETPGCLAWRLNWRELYVLCVEAGVRAEVLLGLMGGYEELDSEDEDDDDEAENDTEITPAVENGEKTAEVATPDTAPQAESEAQTSKPKRDVNSKDYLASTLTIENGNLLDSSQNGVMMTWETSIMEKSVTHLLPSTFSPTSSTQAGLKILNIGFGLGIIDSMFAALTPKPHTHHIIEAHPDVLQSISLPSSNFNTSWEQSGGSEGNYKVHAGKWQAIIPTLLLSGQKYDIIYFDTFGESYTQLKMFFQEYVPHLLTPSSPATATEPGTEGGKFGFFNGLGADRRVCYDVYMNVVEIDSQEVGMEVEWFDVPVGEEVCGKVEGEGEWVGVRRRYWVLDTYRLPILRVVDTDA